MNSVGYSSQEDTHCPKTVSSQSRQLLRCFRPLRKQLADGFQGGFGLLLPRSSNIRITKMKPLLPAIAGKASGDKVGCVVSTAISPGDDVIDLKPNVGGVLAAILAGKVIPPQDLEPETVKTVCVSHNCPPLCSVTCVTPMVNGNGNGRRL
jgi:hypothetical protein